MNDKLKRVVAIFALVLIGVFTVTLILYLFDKNMLNGAVGELALWSGAFGGLLALVLYISRSFPTQQVKDEERERLYDEAAEAELKAQQESEQAQCQELTDEAEPSQEANEPMERIEESDEEIENQ